MTTDVIRLTNFYLQPLSYPIFISHKTTDLGSFMFMEKASGIFDWVFIPKDTVDVPFKRRVYQESTFIDMSHFVRFISENLGTLL